MTNRSVTLEYSDDGGHTWSNVRERSLGEQGEYRKRVRFNRLGAFRARIWRVRTSAPIRVDFLGGVAQLVKTDG